MYGYNSETRRAVSQKDPEKKNTGHRTVFQTKHILCSFMLMQVRGRQRDCPSKVTCQDIFPREVTLDYRLCDCDMSLIDLNSKI